MKNLYLVIIAVLACSWVSGVSADKDSGKHSPESIVACLGGGNLLVLHRSIPESINVEQCKLWAPDQVPDPCASCITSLENQGCKIIDVVVTNIARDPNVGNFDLAATYMMSCVKP